MSMLTDHPQPLIRRIYAFGVHLFTATGAIWGLLAILEIFRHEWKLAILYIVLAILVDGLDGMLARWADVKTYASGIDGALLDNIVDYLNYVLVPVVFFLEGDLLPPAFKLATACLILLTSLYQFTQVDAKTDETKAYFFKGFPCYWNVVLLYMLVMGLDPWINLAFLVLCSILIFVPIKYVYPSRDSRLRRLTLTLTYIYGVVGIYGLALYPHVPRWVVWGSFIYVAYYLALSLWPVKSQKAAA